jgi:DNA-binding CsgD family transcriptional regulator
MEKTYYVSRKLELPDTKARAPHKEQVGSGRGICHCPSCGNIMKWSPISSTEIHVLRLYMEGLSSKEIADKLCVSIKTVDSHRRNLFQKTGMKSLATLTRWAIREGFIKA